MVAGPAAFAVALALLPGWVYWRSEASPRTTRSALAELFEVVAAGAIATGTTVLLYASLPEEVRGYRVGDWLVDPKELSAQFVRNHFTVVSWTVAGLVTFACCLAILAAKVQRRYRKRRNGDQTTYSPEVPLWVETLGTKDHVITVDMRDGRRISGYLGGYSVDDDGTPSIFLTPPLQVEVPAPRQIMGRRKSQSTVADFGAHAITIPGSEITAVWRGFGDED